MRTGAKSLEASEQAPLRCLVADDHPVLCRGLAAGLDAEEDIEVVGHAHDGRAALRLAARRRPHVVVADIHMPEVDGLELTRRLLAEKDPPAVVLYTGFEELDLLDAGLEAGALGFVVKTGPVDDVARAVRAARAGRPYVDATLTGALLERRDDPDGGVLSPRESEVLQLLADGMTTDGVGESLFLSPATVRSYAESAMGKLDGRNRVHAVANALRRQLIR